MRVIGIVAVTSRVSQDGRKAEWHIVRGNISEDVELALQQLGADYQKQPVAFDMAFPDTLENRTRILRFLLADHLPQLPLRPLLDLFDRYANPGEIKIRTFCDHFTIRAGRQSKSRAQALVDRDYSWRLSGSQSDTRSRS